MKFLPLLWACVWRRPARTVLGLVAVSIAFTLYGLALGEAEGFARAAAARHVDLGTGFLLGALAVSAIGMALILFLTANAMAQSVRLRLAEFGVLKAIGYSHRLILLLVAAEAALPCLAGAALGLVAAPPLLGLLKLLLPPLTIFPDLVYTPGLLAAAALLAIFLGAASAALPAARIIRLDVAAALAGGLRAAASPREERRAAREARSVSTEAVGEAPRLRTVTKINQHLARQIAAVTRIGLSTLPLRWKGAVTVAAALTVVTLVMNPLLILMDSFKAMMAVQGSARNVMVTQPGGLSWRDGRIPADWTGAILRMPGIARAANGAPIAEVRTYLNACAHPEGKPEERGCIGLDGPETSGAPLRAAPPLLAGRLNRPGTHEIIMSDNVAAQHGAKVGTRLHLQGQDWLVTGIFTPKTFWVQGNVFGDAAMIRAAGGQQSYMVIQLAFPANLEAFRKAVQAKFQLDVSREDDFFKDYAGEHTRGWTALCYVIGVLFGIGAGAGIFHLMLVTVEGREGEMAVLRAIGFSEAAVASAIVLEAMLLAAAGALLGMLILWFWLDGTIYRFSLPVTVVPARLAMALTWSLGIALLGALSPALAAVRMPVAEALQK